MARFSGKNPEKTGSGMTSRVWQQLIAGDNASAVWRTGGEVFKSN